MKSMRMAMGKVTVEWAVGFVFLAVLAGCGGGSSSSGSNAPVAQVLKQLQAQGKLPTLDTTDTIAGTDADGNGVRDDVDKFIAGLPDTADQKKALTQLAAAVQATMTVDTTDQSKLSAASMALNRGTACVFQQYSTTAANKAYLMEEVTVNTMIRLKAYELYNAARNGSTVALATGAVCN